jgi:hypothetical protein
MPGTRFVPGIVVAFIVICGGTSAAIQDDRQAAAVVWEQAVAAKGGRERLRLIESFAVRETTKFRNQRLREFAGGRVDQIVCRLPHDWWEFLDYRPGKMGYSVSVVDTKSGLGWSTFGGAAREFLRPAPHIGFRMRQLQYVYFLETGAVRPTPLRVSRVRLGSRHVDRVETQSADDFVVFFLDAASQLPVRIETVYRFVSPKPPRPGASASGEMKYVFELDDYREVDGIQIPGRLAIGGDPADVRVEINPDYDPSIFTKPPSPNDGIDSWRR